MSAGIYLCHPFHHHSNRQLQVCHLVSPNSNSCLKHPRHHSHSSQGSRFHVGRNIPMSSFPSPFQSPMTGMSSGSPQLKLVSETSQASFPFESRLQIPLLGRNIPMSSFPSPFQSPITGMSSGKPQLKLVSETSHASFPFESRLQIHCSAGIYLCHPFHHHSNHQ